VPSPGAPVWRDAWRIFGEKVEKGNCRVFSRLARRVTRRGARRSGSRPVSNRRKGGEGRPRLRTRGVRDSMPARPGPASRRTTSVCAVRLSKTAGEPSDGPPFSLVARAQQDAWATEGESASIHWRWDTGEACDRELRGGGAGGVGAGLKRQLMCRTQLAKSSEK